MKMNTPLEGIRVLDFSHALAGPYCTMLLANYGADVYKLESREGDMGRGWGPPFAGGISSFFLGLDRGKRGISIDLKQPAGLDLCLQLIDRMDILIENFDPEQWIAYLSDTRRYTNEIPDWCTVPSLATVRMDRRAMKRRWIWSFRARADC